MAAPSSPTLHFTPREQEVLHGLAQGKAPRRIATELYVSTKTVETYVRRLRQDLGLATIHQLIVYACWWTIYGQARTP